MRQSPQCTQSSVPGNSSPSSERTAAPASAGPAVSGELGVEGDAVTVDPAAEITLSLEGHERRRVVAVAAPDDGGDGGYRFRYDWTVGRRDARHDDGVIYRLPHAVDESYSSFCSPPCTIVARTPHAFGRPRPPGPSDSDGRTAGLASAVPGGGAQG